MNYIIGFIQDCPGLEEALLRSAAQLFTTDDRMIVTEAGEDLRVEVTTEALDWAYRQGIGLYGATIYFRGFVEGVAQCVGHVGALVSHEQGVPVEPEMEILDELHMQSHGKPMPRDEDGRPIIFGGK